MAKLSAKEETRLLNAVERSIDHANHGMTPNDAIEKVAREEQYTQPFIERMVTAFNKSASVARFTKEADASKRKATFPLANTQVIVDRIYGPDKEASAMDIIQFPGDLRKPLLQKVASAKDPFEEYRTMAPRNVIRRLDACKASWDKLANEMKRREDAAKIKLDEALGKASNYMRAMPEESLQKLAQLVVNGYPSNGGSLLKLLSRKAGRTIPVMQKQANAAVFPAKEPYFSIAEIFVTADKYAKAHCDRDYFQKNAAEIVDELVSSVTAPLTKLEETAGGTEEAKGAAKIKQDMDSVLDPTAYNALKEVEARRQFSDLALYDPDLSRYDMPTLIKAFNNSVQLNPDAVANSALLKPMMIQYITQGGNVDIAQVAQHAKLRKDMASVESDKRQALDEKREQVASKEKQDWYKSLSGKSAPAKAK